MPCPGPFRLLTCSIKSMTLVFSLSHVLNILLSIVVWAAARLFFAWLLSARVRRISLMDVLVSCRFVSSSIFQCYPWRFAVLFECRQSGHNSSLNSLVLGFVCGAVSLSQVDVAFNVLDLGVVDIYWCVVYHHHLWLVHLHTLIFTCNSSFLLHLLL